MGSATAGTSAVVPQRTFITVCVMLATLMQTLDTTIVNVALPYIQGSLAASPDQITWTLTAYIVAAAIMTPPIGWVAARIGRKNLFLISIAGFTVASMLCGTAQTLTEIVLYRALQGVFGASLVPLSQTTMLDIYPPELHGRAMSVWTMGVVVGPVLGPTLGGYLTAYESWRYVFYINLPLGILAFAGLWFFMKDERSPTTPKFDWTGFAVLGLAVACLQLLLDRGETKDWFGSTEIIVYAVLCGLGFYLFIVHLFTAKDVLVPLRIFNDRNFAAGLVLIFAVGMLILATSALLAPYLQTLSGRSVENTGLLLAPRGLGTMIGVVIAGRLSDRMDSRILMAIGILIIAETLREMTHWTPDIDAWSLAVNSIGQGFGLGFVFTPLQVLAFATLAPALRTDGTALFSLLRNIGLAIGVSATSVLLTQATQYEHAVIGAALTPFNRNLQTDGAYFSWNPVVPSGVAALNAEVTRQAAIIGYVDDFKFLLVVSLLMLPLLLAMRAPKHETSGVRLAAE